jgi:hypothetical protein
MITKCQPARTVKKLDYLNTYIADQHDPRHLNRTIGSRQLFGIRAGRETAFFQAVDKEIAEYNRDVRLGPKIEILGQHVMWRTPLVGISEAALTEAECEMIPGRVRDVTAEILESETKMKIISQAHIHPMGVVDGHMLAFYRWPRHISPGSLFRQAFDRVHGEINAARQQVGRPIMPTVEERKLEILFHKGFDPLASQLASLGPVTVEDLAEALATLGHSLGPKGIDVRTNTVHVIHQQSTTARAYPYNLQQLLHDAQLAYEALGEDSASVPQMAPEIDTPDVDI